MVDNFDNRVAVLTEQLVDERMESPRHVAEALDELAGTSDHDSDGNTVFSANLARALMGTQDDEQAFFRQLIDQVRTYLSRDASTDAEFRIAKDDDDAAEARDMARSRWAA